MESRHPYRNRRKSSRIKIFEDESAEGLEKKVDDWLLKKGESIEFICRSYLVVFVPSQGELFQPHLKCIRSIVIWYREV